MRPFARHRGELYCEGVPLRRIAGEVGTPAYVYSRAAFEEGFTAVDRALGKAPHLVCYSVKACGNLAVLALLSGLGSGFDVVSGGELSRVLAAGGDPARVVFSGVGKTEDEIALALREGILCLNAESEEELSVISRVATRMRRRAAVALRVNPGVQAHTHPHVATALPESKFGVPLARARRICRDAARLPGVRLAGITCHVGSQIVSVAPFAAAAGRLRGLLAALERDGHPIEHVDLGGGLGVAYGRERPPTPAAWALALRRGLGPSKLRLVVEPGRVIAANAGVLVTRLLYRKRGSARAFAVVDAGMNDLLRPALYGAVHAIEPVGPPAAGSVTLDVVGPVCESADALRRRARVPDLPAGSLWAVRAAGAYGFSMASNYNSRPRPPEVLVSGRRFWRIRRRERPADLWRGEVIPEVLHRERR